MTAIEQIKQQQAEAKLKAKADFLLLADNLAKDEAPPADVLTVLANAGKTAEDLEKVVRVAKERLTLVPKANAFQQIQADKAKAEAELKEQGEVWGAKVDAVQKQAEAVLAPIRKRIADLQQQETDSRWAKQRLQTLASDLTKFDRVQGPITSSNIPLPPMRVAFIEEE